MGTTTITGTPAAAPAPVAITALGNTYVELSQRLSGSVPGIPYDLCQTIVKESYRDIRRKNLWSFQLFESNWVSPAALSSGTASVQSGVSTVTLDSTAAAALAADILANPTLLITQRQFRVGIGTIYNIYNWDGVDTLTLDRAYAEVTNAAASYTIFQCYYIAPYADHMTFITVRDMTMFLDLFLHRKNREILDAQDPQRTWYGWPTDVVSYMLDLNPDSDTYQYPMFELHGHPRDRRVWQLYGIRKMADFAEDTDTLPPQIGSDCLIELAKYKAYEWAEANKGEVPRNQGADYKFLMGGALAEYNRLFREYRRQDREYVNNWLSIRRTSAYGKVFAMYNSIAGTAFPGVAI